MTDLTPPDEAMITCPWLGLAAYGVDDAASYFGRERSIRQLEQLIREHRFAVVLGASGSGKSSLLGGGLTTAGWAPVVVRASAHVLADVHSAIADLPRGEERRSILVIDQLEAAFTECAYDVRQELFDLLLDLAEDDDRGHGGRGLPVVCGLRSDMYGECAVHQRLPDAVSRSHLLLGAPSDADVRAMILGPAGLSGITVDGDVVDDLVDDVLGEPGALPLLSHALAEMWAHSNQQRLQLRDYDAVGGARGSIARAAERTWESLSAAQQAAARDLLVALADPSSPNLDIGRRQQRASVAPLSDGPRETALTVLVDARILTLDGGWVQFSHEAVLREWPRLRGWLDQDRGAIRTLGTLTEQADAWASDGRPAALLLRGGRLVTAVEVAERWPDRLSTTAAEYVAASEAVRRADEEAVAASLTRERRRSRLLRGLLIGACVSLAVALLTTVLALVQRNEADRTRQAARLDALVGRALAERSTERDLAALLALEADRLAGGDPSSRSAMFASLTELDGFLGGTTAPLAFRSVTGSFLPDGRVVIANDDVRLQIADLDTMTFGADLGSGADGALIGEELRVSPDGVTASLVSEHPDGTSAVALYSLATDTWADSAIVLPYQSVNTAFSPDGSLLAVAGGPDGETVVYNVADASRAGTIAGIERPDDSFTYYTAAPAFAPDGSLVIGYEAPTLQVVDTATMRVTATIDVPEFSFNRDLTFSADGSVLLGVGTLFAGSVTLVDWEQRATRWNLGLTDLGITGCAVQALDVPRGHLYCGDYYGKVVQRDLANGARTGHEFSSQSGRIGRLDISPDGTTLVGYGTAQPIISRWRLDGTGPITNRFAVGFTLNEFNADGTLATVVTPPEPGAVRGTTTVRSFPGDEEVDALAEFESARWSTEPDQVFAWRPMADGTWQMVRYDVRAHRVVAGFTLTMAAEPTGVYPDAAVVVTRTESGMAGVYDASTGRRIAPDIDLGPALISIEPIDGGRRLLAMGQAGTSVVDVATGAVVVGPVPAPNFGAVTPQGQLIGSDFAGNVGVYDLATLQTAGTLDNVGGFVQDIRVDRGGTVVVTKGGDRTVRVYDWPSGTQLGDAFALPEQEDSSSGVSPDGSVMTTGGGPAFGSAVWSLDPDAWRGALCTFAGRNLTRAEWQRDLAWSGSYRATCPQFPAADAAAFRFEGTWASADVALTAALSDAPTAAELSETAAGPTQLELLLRNGVFRLRTTGGPRHDLAIGTYAVSGDTITFTTDDGPAAATTTVRAAFTDDELLFNGDSSGDDRLAALLSATPFGQG